MPAAGFLFLWLKNAYHEAYRQLETETNLLFMTSIKELEDSLVHKVFMPRILFVEEKENAFTSIDIQKKHVTELHKGAGSHAKLAFWASRVDSNLHDTIVIRAKKNISTPDKADQIQGSISLYLKLDRELETNQKDSLTQTEAHVVVDLLHRGFKEAIETSDIPLSFTIAHSEASDSLEKGFTSSEYLDILSNESYAVNFPNYKGYLIKKMVPQIAFAFLLFGCTTLAFFMTYKSLRKQQRLSLIKNDFISNVTHELKTPITTVGVAIEALRDFQALKDPEKTQEYLDISQHELNRLSILVDKVLKMSLFEQKEMELKMELLDLQILLNEILKSMKLQFDKFAAKTEFSVKGNNFSFLGDKIHLTNVIYNLIDNALKYSKNNPFIRINLEETAGSTILKIRDNGIGIDKAYQSKIFDKFFRVPTGSRHNVKGYGLGLSYVAGVVQQHQGWVEVDSEPQKGSCFTIYLPKNDG